MVQKIEVQIPRNNFLNFFQPFFLFFEKENQKYIITYYMHISIK